MYSNREVLAISIVDVMNNDNPNADIKATYLKCSCLDIQDKINLFNEVGNCNTKWYLIIPPKSSTGVVYLNNIVYTILGKEIVFRCE